MFSILHAAAEDSNYSTAPQRLVTILWYFLDSEINEALALPIVPSSFYQEPNSVDDPIFFQSKACGLI